jgi:hypothetical protein
MINKSILEVTEERKIEVFHERKSKLFFMINKLTVTSNIFYKNSKED